MINVVQWYNSLPFLDFMVKSFFMKRIVFISLFFLQFFVLECFTDRISGQAEDSPQWGQRFSRNQISNEANLPKTFKPGRRHPQTGLIAPETMQNVLWTAPIGEIVYGTPVVAEGCVFIGSNHSSSSDPALQGDKGVLSCLDEKTGQLLWELVVPKLFEIRYADWYRVGICSTPVVEDGKVYTVTNRCDVLCLDIHGMKNGNQGPFLDEASFAVPKGEKPITLDTGPESRNGDILWRTSLVERLGVMPHNASNCSVLMDGDVLYVCTGNGVDWEHRRVMNPEAPTLIVLDKKTGDVLAVDDFGIGPNIIHGQWSSPALGTIDGRRLVVQGTGGGWIFAVEALSAEQIEEARNRILKRQPPAKLRNIWRFNGHPLAQTQEVVALEHFHDTKSYHVIANPVFLNDRIYVVFTQELYHNIPDGRLICLNASKACKIGGDVTRSDVQLWNYNEMSSSASTVAVQDGLVYLTDGKGQLHCLDVESGKAFWVFPLGGSVWSSPLLADGKIYIGTGRRLFWIIKHQTPPGEKPEVIEKISLPGPIYASAVAANEVLYVPVFGTLYALKNLEGTDGQ